MKKVIYFTDGEGVKPFKFVKAYRKKSLLKSESAQLSYFVHELDIDDEMAERIKCFIKKHYPDAVIGYDTVENFEETMFKYRYYAVCKFTASGTFCGFNTGYISHGEPVWKTEIEDAQLHYEHTSAEDSAKAIAAKTGERVTLTTVYILNANQLSEQEFVITCKSKRTGKTQFYARQEGTRLRLVRTSDAAAKFHYNLAIDMFDELKAGNKAFLYSVIPYIPNVNCADLEKMYEEKKIPLAIMMTTKLKWMNRE